MSAVGVRRAAEEGRLSCRRSVVGQRLFDRVDLDAYLGRPAPAEDVTGQQRVEALYCRVSGSTGRESSLANEEPMLRDTAQGRVFRCIAFAGRACASRGGR
jgi:putative resolvase